MATKDSKDPQVNSPKNSKAQEKKSPKQLSLGEFLSAAADSSEGGDKAPKKRPYFLFQESGLVVPFWAIVSFEKVERLFSSTGGDGPRWRYGIVLNRGIEVSPNMPFGEHTLYWTRASIRDDKFNALVAAMEEHNYEFNKI